MIPNNTDMVEVISSGFDDSFGMGVHKDSIAHIMSVLTKMYAEPDLAVIREYSANAYDSHVKAGQKRPIEITLPSRWNDHTFSVQDYGVGMNVDYMRDTYSQYGASDKRDDNDAIGGFGIGSKAGLAYTHSFTIDAVKDGIKSRAIVSLDAEGVGKFDIVDTVSTTEPNGVKISVSVKDTMTFTTKATNFFSFWEPGTVLVDGAEPAPRLETKMNDSVSWVDGVSYYDKRKSHIVMGNIPYALDVEKVPVAKRLNEAGIRFTLRMPIGSVSIAPNREQLQLTPGSIANIEVHLSGLMDEITQAKLDKVSAAETLAAAHRAWRVIESPFNENALFKAFTHRGLTLSLRCNWIYDIIDWDYNDRGFVTSKQRADIGRTLDQTQLIVTGFKGEKISPVMKRKMRHYADEHDLNDDYIIVCDEDTDEPWFREIARVTWDVVKGVKLPAGTYTPAAKRVPTYSIYLPGQGRSVVTDLPSGPLFYMSSAEAWRKSGYSRVNVAMPLLADQLGAPVVEISMNRWDKFRKEYPHAKHARVGVSDKIAELVAASSDYTMDENLDWSVKTFLTGINPDEVLDTEYADVVRLYRNGVKDDKFAQALALYNNFSKGECSVTRPERKKNRAQDILNRYPLVRKGGDREHLLFYINAYYTKHYAN